MKFEVSNSIIVKRIDVIAEKEMDELKKTPLKDLKKQIKKL